MCEAHSGFLWGLGPHRKGDPLGSLGQCLNERQAKVEAFDG